MFLKTKFLDGFLTFQFDVNFLVCFQSKLDSLASINLTRDRLSKHCRPLFLFVDSESRSFMLRLLCQLFDSFLWLICQTSCIVPVAQRKEYPTPNRNVAGSTPARDLGFFDFTNSTFLFLTFQVTPMITQRWSTVWQVNFLQLTLFPWDFRLAET